MDRDLVDELMTEPFLEFARESDADEVVESLWSPPARREARTPSTTRRGDYS